MKEIPAGYVEVSKGVYERRDRIKKASPKIACKPQAAQLEPTLFDESLSEIEGKKGDPSRMLVCIESVRKKLLDKDNLYGGAKFFCDFLRLSGVIREDTEKEIDLQVTQRKPKKSEVEKTVIEVWKRSQ